MVELTERQRRVLSFVDQFARRHGFPPTMREIGDGVGLTNQNAVRGHLGALERKGYITRVPDKARSIRLLRAPSPLSGLKRRLHEILRTDEGVLHQVVYGLACVCAGRTPCFAGPLQRQAAAAVEQETLEHGWSIIEQRIEPDHMALVVKVWPNHSPELAVRRLKAAAESVVQRRSPGLQRGPVWARGYAATTDLALLDALVEELLHGQTGEGP